MESRRVQRAGFDLPTRVTLLEDDADRVEEEREDEAADRKGMQRLVVGAVIAAAFSFIVEAVLLYLQNKG